MKRKCKNVESVTEGADRKRCSEASAKIVKIEINNCSDCVFNHINLSCLIRHEISNFGQNLNSVSFVCKLN